MIKINLNKEQKGYWTERRIEEPWLTDSTKDGLLAWTIFLIGVVAGIVVGWKYF